MKHLFSAAVAVVVLLSSAVQAKKYDMVEWENPIPRFSAIGLDAETVADMIGDGQMVLVRPGTDIHLWSKGEVREFHNVRFSSAISVIDADVNVVKQRVVDIEGMEDFMPQIEDSRVTDREGRHFMADFTQVYDLPGPFDLKAGFVLQHTLEPNGDVSILVHKGDIDTGVSRWEFIPLKNGKTLSVFSTWQDLDSAGLAFKVLLKAQPELKPTIPAIAAAMVLQQVKDSFSDQEKTNLKKMSNEGFPLKGRVPLFTRGEVPIPMLETLASKGTVMLVHPKQVIQGRKHPMDFIFVSAINVLPGDIHDVKPISSDFSRMREYFPWAQEIEKDSNEFGELIRMKMKVDLPVISIKVDNTVQGHWQNENVMLFEATQGDMYPMMGAWEYLPVKQDNTMVIFTSASKIGDDASWLLKMMRNIPLTDLVMSLHMGMVMTENQEPWVLSEIAKKQAAVAAGN